MNKGTHITRKPTFWVSLVITAFMLFALWGVFNLAPSNGQSIVLNSATQQAIDLQPVQASISAEQAASLAQGAVGIQPSAAAELVDYEGAAAYEVPFANGNIYVDANNGALLYNGLSQAQAAISPEQAAQVAASYLQRTDVVRVQALLANGVEVYRVDFTSGDIVVVDTQGRILLVQQVSNTTSQSGSEHEEHDDD